MKSIVSLPDARTIFKTLIEEPEKMFDLLRIDMKNVCERTVSELLKLELTNYLGRKKYQRSCTEKPSALSSNTTSDTISSGSSLCHCNSSPPGQKNYRNGYYYRNYTAKSIGTLRVKVPRDRLGHFNSQLISKYDRYEKKLEKDLALMFLSGISTRGVSLISETLIGRKISSSEVSQVNQELLTGIDSWRTRPLNDMKVKYVIVDGVFFPMRVKHSVEKIPMLVVIGVTEDNRRLILCIQQGDKDCASTWREIFKDLKSRGLDHQRIQLGIMDGLTGLERVFKDEFPNSKVQRCTVHVARNVMTKTPKKLKEKVADRIRDIFYASSKEKALERYKSFYKEYENIIPSAIKSLDNSIQSCLTFYSFPKEEWASLRTTNIIERLNKEFKRRTKSMEILAGEKSAYRLLSFIALKMEIGWRKAPFGRKNMKLPPFEKFTQST